MNRTKLSKDSRRNLGKLSLIHFLRLTGVFFMLPLIVVYARTLSSNLILDGLALGSYEIAMSAMQIPSIFFSKKTGTKNYLYIGLSFFVIGNYLSFISTDIYTLIISRFITGLGAISSPITSLAIESVPPDRKNTAMVITGIGIGFAFLGGIGFAPLIGMFIGIRNFFLVSTILGILAMVIVFSIREGLDENTLRYPIIEKVETKKIIFLSSFCLATATFIIFFTLQNIYFSIYGLFNYGLIIFFSVFISGVIGVTISEFFSRIFKIHLLRLSVFLILIGLVLFFLFIMGSPNIYIAAIVLIPFISGLTIYEIAAVPTLFSSIGYENRNPSLGKYFTLQYSGNGFGALLAGTLSFYLAFPDLEYTLLLSGVALVLLSLIGFFRS